MNRAAAVARVSACLDANGPRSSRRTEQLPWRDRLADLSLIDDRGRAAFDADLHDVLANYDIATDSLDRNPKREAASSWRKLLDATKIVRALIADITAARASQPLYAAGLIAQWTRVRTRDSKVLAGAPGLPELLARLETACDDECRKPDSGGAPTKHGRDITIVALARLHATHGAVLAARDRKSFAPDGELDRRATFAQVVRKSRIRFVAEALASIGVVVPDRTIRTVIAADENVKALELPEAFYDQRDALKRAVPHRVAATRARERQHARDKRQIAPTENPR